MALVVFSDLDGTLLEHHTYSYQAARPALDELKRRGIPLVLCSSKTRAELIPLHAELGLSAPFIAENGGGIFAPADCLLAAGEGWQEAGGGWRLLPIGLPVAEVRRRLAGFQERLGVRGFGQMSDAEVARLTGLSKAQAAWARQREFNEPVLLGDEARSDEFAAAAQAAGLSAVRGGRFWHLLGGGDKGKAVRLLVILYAKRDPALVSLALGDAPNDLSMLAAVDRPVLVARPDGSHAPLDLAGLRREPLPGPSGFNQAVLAALAELA
ncbi:MAG: HAD-IIB family hydrolase [Thermodesulfobacteriota bacterium]